MLIRALIVVLVVLNLGTALWWLGQSPAAAVEDVAPAPVAGVAALQLLPPPAATESPAPTAPAASDEPAVAPEPAPAPAPPVAADAVAPVPAAPATAQCVSLGPFAERPLAESAAQKLAGQLDRSHLREVPPSSGSYRVLLRGATSREEAQARVRQIVAAGIGDYFIIASGEEAHAIALGQYRNREGAERRLAELKAAGFAAELLASGGSPAFWLDAALKPGINAAGLAVPGIKPRALDCRAVR